MDILSNLTNLLGQAAGGGQAAPSRQGGGDTFGGLLNPQMLTGLMGALMGGGASRTTGAQAGGGLGDIGSLVGMLMGGGGGGQSAGGGLGGALGSMLGGGGGGGMGGVLGALLGGAMGGGEAPQPPPPPAMPAADTPQNKTTNMLRALVYAARADGHIDAQEQAAISQQVQSLGLGREAQAVVNQAISEPLNPNNIAKNITSQDESVRIFALSCAVCRVDDEREKAYIADLGSALGIPAQTQQALINRMLGR